VGLGFPTSRRRGCGQGLIVGDVLVLPEAEEQVNGVQRFTVMSNAWSSWSIASRTGAEGGLETCRAAGASA
jgi:hypothetical protein